MLVQTVILEVLIITTPHNQMAFERLLGDGSRWSMAIQYAIQTSPNGLGHAFLIGADFPNGARPELVLGDNLLHGYYLQPQLAVSNGSAQGATVYDYPMSEPEGYEVVAFEADVELTGLEEKPAQPKSRHTATRLYFYNVTMMECARSAAPSARFEPENTDFNSQDMDNSRSTWMTRPPKRTCRDSLHEAVKIIRLSRGIRQWTDRINR
jgi:glucose-1-phosphate thymidylyltransferase